MRTEFMPFPVNQIPSFTSSAKRINKRGLAAMLAILLSLVAIPNWAEAQTLTVLYSFTGQADGGFPNASLIRDSAGNLYGTTAGGGAFGWGTVFELDSTGKETMLYSFTDGADGATPYASVIRDAAGNLYGTTSAGGLLTCNNGNGCGTVFKLDTAHKLTVLHTFTGSLDGEIPMGRLVRDGAGNLYGTTEFGGSSNSSGSGIVFKLSSAGKETVLHRFTGGTDGADPVAGLIRDSAGNLYGTTQFGGAFDWGTVFKLNSTGKETVLYSFSDGADGAAPYAGVIRDSAGNLYGTATLGGAIEACAGGCGTVFKLDTSSKFTTLYSFTGDDGKSPYAGVIRDAAGNLYGTTMSGGSGGTFSPGTAFKLDATGKESVLHNFVGGTDGADPVAGLILDAAGNLFGTTSGGGSSGAGIVFKIAP